MAQMMLPETSLIERAKLKTTIDKKEKELFEINSSRSVSDRVKKHYESFDELCFYLSENGKESLENISRMNTYQFYRYKTLVGEKIKHMNKEIERVKNK